MPNGEGGECGWNGRQSDHTYFLGILLGEKRAEAGKEKGAPA